MAGPQYTLIPNDWVHLESIINDLTSRVITQSLTEGDSPTFENITITDTATIANIFTPFTATTTTVCPNLNADLLDGQDGSYYAAAGGYTAGSILFADTSGLISQDNANLFWNNADNRLGVGTATPAYRLDVGQSADGIAANFLGGAAGTGIIQLKRTSGLTATWSIALPSGRLTFRDEVADTTVVGFYYDSGSSPARIMTSVDLGGNGLPGNDFRVRGGYAGTTGIDTKGGDLFLSGGLGRGDGTQSSIYFQTPDKVGTGNTIQTYSTKMQLTGLGNLVIGNNTAYDFSITFNALTNDGVITFYESDNEFDFGSSLLTTTGTVKAAILHATNTASLLLSGTGVTPDIILHNDGTRNLYIGVDAGTHDPTGAADRCCIGFGTGHNLSGAGAVQNVYVGSYAGFGATAATNNTGGYNVGIGYGALYRNTSGGANLALGASALVFNTTGSYNLAMAANAMCKNTTGVTNTAIGYAALFTNVSGNYNTAIGSTAGYSSVGSNNVYIGYYAGYYQVSATPYLIIDNQNRTSAALELTNALIVGVFNAAPASQTLALNAAVSTPYTLGVTGLITATGGIYIPSTEDIYFNATTEKIWSADAGYLDLSATKGIRLNVATSTAYQITSTLAIGTSPFNVTSTTVNTNLNADLLDGQHGSYYRALTLAPIVGGTGTITVTAANTEKTYVVDTSGGNVTADLPTATLGLRYRFIIGTAGNDIILNPYSGEKIRLLDGTLMSANENYICTSDTVSDGVIVECLLVAGEWQVTMINGTWVQETP